MYAYCRDQQLQLAKMIKGCLFLRRIVLRYDSVQRHTVMIELVEVHKHTNQAMSSNTIDYEGSNVDPGGDSAYDSSNYGTTTGDLSSDSHPQGAFGSGSDRSSQSKSSGTGLRASGQDVVNHEQWGKNSGEAGKLGGHGGEETSSAPSGEGMSADETRTAQGYTKTNDMNPEIGG